MELLEHAGVTPSPCRVQVSQRKPAIAGCGGCTLVFSSEVGAGASVQYSQFRGRPDRNPVSAVQTSEPATEPGSDIPLSEILTPARILDRLQAGLACSLECSVATGSQRPSVSSHHPDIPLAQMLICVPATLPRSPIDEIGQPVLAPVPPEPGACEGSKHTREPRPGPGRICPQPATG